MHSLQLPHPGDNLMGVADEAVPYYDKERFLILPDDMADEEKAYLMEFIG